jgi:glutamate-ammonia-ligase adenylyltransferase
VRVDSGVFFARLAQRIIHIISTRTGAGRLYETDLRLRPSGASGLLVTSISAMQAYQQEQAWTWEHQALVRARPVAGDPAVGRAFDAIRRKVLSQTRDPQALRTEVCQMREKMRRSLGSRQTGKFHLKQDPGGIADIEFLVQFGVLRWSADYPALLQWTDNIRLLDTLADCGLLPRDTAEALAEAYRKYRKAVHRLALEDLPPLIANDAFAEQRRAVSEQWRQWLQH